MSNIDHTQDVVVQYAVDDTYNALKRAVQNNNDFKVDSFDDIMKTAHLKVGISLLSWGENVTISLTPNNNSGTNISFLSTPKVGSAAYQNFDMGKNRKNINKLMNSLSKELEKISPVNSQNITNNSPNAENNSIFCSNCGNSVNINANFCENCGAVIEQSPKTCHQCGKEIKQGANFCNECGSKV